MLQKLGDHISSCRQRAIDATNRAALQTDPILKVEYIALADQWRHLAQSYEFSESLERFLLESQHAKDAIAPTPPKE